MSDLARKCPECGAGLPADSPASLCPHCLIHLGFEPVDDDAPNAPPAPNTGDAPPALAVSETVITSLPALTKVRYFGDYELLSEIAHGGWDGVSGPRHTHIGQQQRSDPLARCILRSDRRCGKGQGKASVNDSTRSRERLRSQTQYAEQTA